jgi:CRP/FNR family transcriptional regulator
MGTAKAPVGAYGVLRGYRADTQVCGQGETAADVYLIQTGVIKLTWMDPEGRETIVGLRWPGSFLGASSVIASEPIPTSIITLAPSTLERIPGARFLDLLHSDSSLSMRVHEMQSREILEQVRDIAGFAVESAKQRFKTFLRRLAQSLPDPVCLPDGRLNSPLTKKDLAALLGIEPAYLSRLLQDLAAEGIIRLNKQWIIVQNIEKLLPEQSSTYFIRQTSSGR